MTIEHVTSTSSLISLPSYQEIKKLFEIKFDLPYDDEKFQDRLFAYRPLEKTTYSPFPSLWPQEIANPFSFCPYLILERSKEKIEKAPFSEKLFTAFNKPIKGKLLRHDDGFVYLNIPRDVVKTLLGFIRDDFDFSRLPELIGSKVRVSLPQEKIEMIEIEEIGEEFYFSLKASFSISLPHCPKVFFLQIDCPALEKMRMKYGLKASPSPYMLTSVLAIFTSDEKLCSSDGYFRISPAVLPV
ncbi:MAG: hypothetical protein FJZ56_01020 [Chlamydiae bacterium]|nr:hypothetical protein [Chlamydiota bacterium]